MAGSKLILIDAGLFCEGMLVNAPIYYLYKKSYVLLCKEVLLTTELINKLNTVAKATDGVYIPETAYEEIWDESLRIHSLESLGYEEAYESVRDDYEKVLTQTVGLLNEVTTGTVSLPLVEHITKDIAHDIESTDQALMLRCVNMINEVDQYLYTHCINVATLNGLIGKWLKLSNEDINLLIQCGLVHDLGKLKVNPDILNKAGRLTKEEFEEIKLHPLLSYEMLSDSGETDPRILQAALQHHEKPNRTGYPKGLSMEEISTFARITSVSDVYDAMVSKRCYKTAQTPFEVLAQFKENRFSDLDREIVNVFLANITFLYIGMKVKLSNGEQAEVVFVPPHDYANPIVKIGDRIFSTSEENTCVTVDDLF